MKAKYALEILFIFFNDAFPNSVFVFHFFYDILNSLSIWLGLDDVRHQILVFKNILKVSSSMWKWSPGDVSVTRILLRVNVSDWNWPWSNRQLPDSSLGHTDINSQVKTATSKIIGTIPSPGLNFNMQEGFVLT